MMPLLYNITSLRKHFGDYLWLQGETELAAAQNRNNLIFIDIPTEAFMF